MAKSTSVVVPPNAAAFVPLLEVVGAGRPAERHVEVRMHVDPAGDDVLPARVDPLVDLFERLPLADGSDLLVFDQQIGFERVARVTSVPFSISVLTQLLRHVAVCLRTAVR